MTQTARLVGGPAHGREYAVPEGQSTVVCTAADEDITGFLATWDPLEALYDPLYGLTPVAFSQHLYARQHLIRGAEHPCVRDLALVEHRYPWLHQGLDPEDPLISAWALAEPPDRTEWLVREFGRWTSIAHSYRRGLDRWLAGASLDGSGDDILVPAPDHRKGPPVVSAADLATTARKREARVAADRARLLYPGPVGEILGRELQAWSEFAYRFAGDNLVDRLVDFVLDPTRQTDLRGITHPGVDTPPGA